MVSGSGSPPLLREVNCARALATLRESGPQRLADLAVLIGVSRPTVGQVVRQLEAAGLIAEAEPHGRARPGRRPRFVRFRSEAGYVAGIDVSRDRVLVLVADLLGTVVGRHRLVTSAALGTSDLLASLRAATHTALSDAGVTYGQLVSVAAGTPAVVDATRGTVRLAQGTTGWTIDLAGALGRSFPGKVTVDDSGKLAALAERWHGAARDADTAVVVQWGERVQAGILIGGRLHRGAANAADRIGMLALEPGGTAERDEQGLGPFDRMVGAGAIAAAGKRVTARVTDVYATRDLDGPADGAPGGLNAQTVCGAAARGDARATAAVREIAARFVRGLAPLLVLLDPDVVVIGGRVSQAGQMLLDAIGDNVRRMTAAEPRLALSPLGDEAVALGAVKLALLDAERRILPGPAVP